MKPTSPSDRLPLAIPPRDRFVRAIAERVPPDRIAEVHLFQPIRQGGVETGVAVIAAEEPSETSAANVAADAPVTEVEVGLALGNENDDGQLLAVRAAEPMEDEEAASLADDFADDIEADPYHRVQRGERHRVYTAWYRLTLKGPDRGKWEFNLADEAVAPLETIVAVARGVGERAGDAEDPERWTGEHFRTALSEIAG